MQEQMAQFILNGFHQTPFSPLILHIYISTYINTYIQNRSCVKHVYQGTYNTFNGLNNKTFFFYDLVPALIIDCTNDHHHHPSRHRV